MGKSFKKEIGVVGVDSGQLIVGDPCYFGNWKNDEYDNPDSKPNDMSYSNACRLTLSEDMAGEIPFGRAVVFSSGFGDGVYPVIAHYKDYGTEKNPDVRIRKVEIILID
jgi:hypothetical protein